MRHVGLFEGIGGFSLAARWMGWETVAWCEWNPILQHVLRYHFPEAEGYGDITKTDFTKFKNAIDIITGGFPCQPYSTAGKRKGKEDERHLWPEMLRAIREISPRWVVGENVRGITNWGGGVVFNEVQTDLETAGYEILPFLLPACAVNAPHRRDRVWFIAHTSGAGDGKGTGGINQPRKLFQATEWEENKQFDKLVSSGGIVTNTIDKRLQGDELSGSFGERDREKAHGSVTEPLKIYSWDQWPTQSPVCVGDDGLSGRLDGITFSKMRIESLKAAGNAIVPQVAFEIFKAIQKYDQTL